VYLMSSIVWYCRYLLCSTDRTENRSRSVGVKCIVMILTIIIVAIMTVTFLCTHYTSGRSVAEIPKSTVIHRYSSNSGNYRDGLSEKSTAAVIDLDVSDTSAGRGPLRIAPTEFVSDTAGDQRVTNFRSAKHPWTGESENLVWPSVGWSRSTDKTNPYPADRNGEYEADRTAELWDINYRLILLNLCVAYNGTYIWFSVATQCLILYQHCKILFKFVVEFFNSRSNHRNHQNTKSDKWAGPHVPYDLIYSLDHNAAFKHTDTDMNVGIGLRPHYSIDNGAYYEPIAESPSNMHYRPFLRSPPIYPVLDPQTKISISKKEKFDWRTIGILLLVKAGLIKLKLFGILKILFLLLFKLKLFLIAIFVKFLLLLKSSKLFKTLFLPPIFLILMTLFLAIIMSAMYLLPRQSINMMSPPLTSSLSNSLSSLLSNLPGIPDRPGLTKSSTSDQFPNILKNILAGRSSTFIAIE